MRRPKDNDDNTQKKQKLKGKVGGRLKHYNVDGDGPLCLRKIDEESKDGSSNNNKKNSKEKNDSGSSSSNSMKDGSKRTMTSGSEDLCGGTIEKNNNEKMGKQKAKTSRSSC